MVSLDARQPHNDDIGAGHDIFPHEYHDLPLSPSNCSFFIYKKSWFFYFSTF